MSVDVAEQFMIGVVPYGEQYGGWVSIPYLTPNGVVQIKYRDIDGGDPKYLYEAGLGAQLFNAQALINATDTVILTEGEFDAMICQVYLGIPAVGYPGVGTWKEHGSVWRLCFEDVSEVIVVADGDKPGRARAKEIAESIGLAARVVDLGDSEDSNSFFLKHGVRALTERLMV